MLGKLRTHVTHANAMTTIAEANTTGFRDLGIKKTLDSVTLAASTVPPTGGGFATARSVTTQLRLSAGQSVEARVQLSRPVGAPSRCCPYTAARRAQGSR